MKLGFASDHAGYDLKERLKVWAVSRGHEVVDFGTHGSVSVDYPDFVHRAVAGITRWERLILVCGSGIGVTMAANRYTNIRCALVTSVEHAKLAREHNDANTIAFGQRITDPLQAEYYLKTFLETSFLGFRHESRIKKINTNVFSARNANELRLINFKTKMQTHVDGSCLIQLGDTKVLCSADIKEQIPIDGHEHCKTSIITKYTILPHDIDIQTNKKAPSLSIYQKNQANAQQLISRSLSSAVNFQLLGERNIAINCYVINVDGDTICATISCAWLALALALYNKNLSLALLCQVAAVNVGILDANYQGENSVRCGSVLDIERSEDALAIVKYNAIVADNKLTELHCNMATKNQLELLEFQPVSNKRNLTKSEMMDLTHLGLSGCQTIIAAQRAALIEKY